jgi:hypothetical protein
LNGIIMAKKIETPVSDKLTSADAVAIQAIAIDQADADKSFETRIAHTAECVARIMGESPSFAHWARVADAFQREYIVARGCAASTANNRWLAVAEQMAALFALEKPKSDGADALRKTAMREEKAKETAKLVKGKSPAQLADEAARATSIASELAVQAAKAKPAEAGEALKAAKAAKETADTLAKAARDSVATLHRDAMEKVHAKIKAHKDAVKLLMTDAGEPQWAALAKAAADIMAPDAQVKAAKGKAKQAA